MAKLKVRRFTYSWEYSGIDHQVIWPDPFDETVGDTKKWSYVGIVFSLLVDQRCSSETT